MKATVGPTRVRLTSWRGVLVCIVSLLALVAGACGGSSDDDGGSSGDASGSEKKGDESDGPALELVKGDRFTIMLPKGAELETQELEEQGLTLNLYTAEVDGAVYGLNYTDVPEGTPINVDGAIEGSASNIGGKAVDKQPLTYKGFEAMDARIVGAQQGSAKGTGFTRVISTPGRLYQIITIVPGEDVPVVDTHVEIRESLTLAS